MYNLTKTTRHLNGQFYTMHGWQLRKQLLRQPYIMEHYNRITKVAPVLVHVRVNVLVALPPGYLRNKGEVCISVLQWSVYLK